MPRATRKSRGSEPERSAAKACDEALGVEGPPRLAMMQHCDAATIASLSVALKDPSMLRSPEFLAAYTEANHQIKGEGENDKSLADVVDAWVFRIARQEADAEDGLEVGGASSDDDAGGNGGNFWGDEGPKYKDPSLATQSPISSVDLRSLASRVFHHGTLETPNVPEKHWGRFVQNAYEGVAVPPSAYVGGGKNALYEAEESIALLSVAKGDVSGPRVLFAVTGGSQNNCDFGCSFCSHTYHLRVDALLEGEWKPLLIHVQPAGMNNDDPAPRVYMPSDAVCAQLTAALDVPKAHLGALVRLLAVSNPMRHAASQWEDTEFVDTTAAYERWWLARNVDSDSDVDDDYGVGQVVHEYFEWNNRSNYQGTALVASYPSMNGVDEEERNNGEKSDLRHAGDEKDGAWWQSRGLSCNETFPERGYSPRWLSFVVQRLFVKTPLPETIQRSTWTRPNFRYVVSKKNKNLDVSPSVFQRRWSRQPVPLKAYESLPDLCAELAGWADGPPRNFKRNSSFEAWVAAEPTHRERHGVWRLVSALEQLEWGSAR